VEKSRPWSRTKFPVEVITAALDDLVARADPEAAARLLDRGIRSVQFPNEEWRYDTDAEFFADYRRDNVTGAHYAFSDGGDLEFRLYLERSSEADFTRVAIRARDRETIEAVFARFENAALGAAIAGPQISEPVIFIGHGHSGQWRDLKDHLQDQHGYQVEAYEVGARAGHGIRDVLEAMLERSSIAFLVLTGDDADADGNLYPRDNVIHETGLFQGHLGWPRAIVLVEEGVVEFSNIHGIQQIRFARGNIRATFGDVLATLQREFGRPG
jgi:predicted nucleotide-binding protein